MWKVLLLDCTGPAVLAHAYFGSVQKYVNFLILYVS